LALDRAVIRPVRLDQPLLKSSEGIVLAPQAPVVVGSSGHDPEAAPGASADPPGAGAFDDGWVDIVFGPVAVDGRAPGRGQ
jgi:hypothetical protein